MSSTYYEYKNFKIYDNHTSNTVKIELTCYEPEVFGGPDVPHVETFWMNSGDLEDLMTMLYRAKCAEIRRERQYKKNRIINESKKESSQDNPQMKKYN